MGEVGVEEGDGRVDVARGGEEGEGRRYCLCVLCYVMLCYVM